MRLALLLGPLTLVAAAQAAQAHAFLVKSDPPVGSVIAAKPAALRLEFSEAIELGFSGLDVSPASGGAISMNGVRFAESSHKVLIANLPMLQPGVYRVKWHVVSVDTHRTEGEFTFTVKP